MPKNEFYQLDVFTTDHFAGNPLAVFPDAEGIPEREMQSIANEMNLSETVFVLPSERALKRLRIFTPKQELPLAGHPVVGAWNLLARLGVTPARKNGTVIVDQELNIGVLPVEIEFAAGEVRRVVMTQGAFETAAEIDDEDKLIRLAESLGLTREEIVPGPSLPVGVVSTGIRALDVPVASLNALGRIRVNSNLLSEIYSEYGAVGCLAFTSECMEDSSSVHTRFFAPADGIPEDPATGSAAGSLAGYLVYHGAIGKRRFTIEQGDFIGRPSRIEVAVSGSKGKISKVRVGGPSVVVAKGEMLLN